MILEAFRLWSGAPKIEPCSHERAWMDATPDRHAYRCLPLAIANTHGWAILVPQTFTAEWTGGPERSDVWVSSEGSEFAESNFACGILTLHVWHLFRTPPGWNLLMTGPFNSPKPGMTALTGVIESDWLSYPATMNWRFTEPGVVTWKIGEVFCMVMPVPRGLEEWNVQMRDMGDDPELEARYRAMRASREANPLTWQKHYFTGRNADGTLAPAHTHKLRLQCPR